LVRRVADDAANAGIDKKPDRHRVNKGGTAETQSLRPLFWGEGFFIAGISA
jgi:hypothetical protein